MYALSSPTFWVRYFSEFRCHHCGSPDGYVSRSRNPFEKYGLRLLFLRPARCGDCYERSYRPLRVPLLPRPKSLDLEVPTMVSPAPSIADKVPGLETLNEEPKRQHIA
jgi:hypothetical protein